MLNSSVARAGPRFLMARRSRPESVESGSSRASVEGDRVQLNRTGAEARDEWGVEAVGATPGADDEDEHGAEPGSAKVGP